MQASTGSAGAEMIGGAAAADQSQVEAASPISSRPPVDEFAGAADEDEPDRGVSGGNRWPRQETLALLRIRSEMDATFRDATLKGPLWEDVSRKLGELGYRRSAKKCKEKFENVHKYYKRTKEGRAGRQDGKTYKFFTELEALNATTTTTVLPLPAAVGVAQNVVVSSPSPMPITSISYPQVPFPIFRPAETAAAPPPASAASFSTDSASTSPMSEDYEGGGSRKRKRNTPKMVEVLEGMMKKVMAEQEAMQRRFLEAVDKREQERTAREEAWRRQESARLAREHDLLAHERAVSASRDAAIISFLQKLTGQTIPIPSPPTATAPPPPPPQQQQHHQPQQQQQQQQLPAAPALMAVPEQQVQEVSGSMSSPASGAGSSSSRWPKAEVLALIKLRSGLEGRYQEAGPKGPLWEEVSLGMGRMGYKRSSKRCKEKWENINKYFKKVKESNKKRPEDAKTCPYFHQLDALYRKKSITQQQQQQEPTQTNHDLPQNNNGGRSETQPSGVAAANLFGEEATKKPEDIVKDVMMEQQLMVDDYDDKMNESDEDIGEDEDGEEEDEERNGNMEYKIEFQRPNNNSNGGGNNNEAPSFFAMVQ